MAGLELFGQTSFSGLSPASSTTGTVTLDPGEVSYNNPSLPATAATGPLRASLWAVPGTYNGGAIAGTVVARYNIQFSDGTYQLKNGTGSNLSPIQLSAGTPARGSYCMVVTLEEFNSTTCTSADHYCVVDWQQFPASNEFQ